MAAPGEHSTSFYLLHVVNNSVTAANRVIGSFLVDGEIVISHTSDQPPCCIPAHPNLTGSLRDPRKPGWLEKGQFHMAFHPSSHSSWQGEIKLYGDENVALDAGPNNRFRMENYEYVRMHESFFVVATKTLRAFIHDTFAKVVILRDSIAHQPPLPSAVSKYRDYVLKAAQAHLEWTKARLAFVDNFAFLAFLIFLAKLKAQFRNNPANQWLKDLEAVDLSSDFPDAPDKEQLAAAWGGFLQIIRDSWVDDANPVCRAGVFVDCDSFRSEDVSHVVNTMAGVPLYIVWTRDGLDIVRLRDYFRDREHYCPPPERCAALRVMRAEQLAASSRKQNADERSGWPAPASRGKSSSGWAPSNRAGSSDQGWSMAASTSRAGSSRAESTNSDVPPSWDTPNQGSSWAGGEAFWPTPPPAGPSSALSAARPSSSTRPTKPKKPKKPRKNKARIPDPDASGTVLAETMTHEEHADLHRRVLGYGSNASRFRQGDTFWVFLERRFYCSKLKRASVAEDELLKIKERERLAMKWQISHSCSVYEWEIFTDGAVEAKQANKGDYETLMERWKKAQMLYDPILHRWDCAKWLDPADDATPRPMSFAPDDGAVSMDEDEYGVSESPAPFGRPFYIAADLADHSERKSPTGPVRVLDLDGNYLPSYDYAPAYSEPQSLPRRAPTPPPAYSRLRPRSPAPSHAQSSKRPRRDEPSPRRSPSRGRERQQLSPSAGHVEPFLPARPSAHAEDRSGWAEPSSRGQSSSGWAAASSRAGSSGQGSSRAAMTSPGWAGPSRWVTPAAAATAMSAPAEVAAARHALPQVAIPSSPPAAPAPTEATRDSASLAPPLLAPPPASAPPQSEMAVEINVGGDVVSAEGDIEMAVASPSTETQDVPDAVMGFGEVVENDARMGLPVYVGPVPQVEITVDAVMEDARGGTDVHAKNTGGAVMEEVQNETTTHVEPEPHGENIVGDVVGDQGNVEPEPHVENNTGGDVVGDTEKVSSIDGEYFSSDFSRLRANSLL